jgi:hypothetical protein
VNLEFWAGSKLEGTPRLETETVLMLVGKALLGFSREMLEVNSWVGVLEVVGSLLEGWG